jgi:hypothetical protein
LPHTAKIAMGSENTSLVTTGLGFRLNFHWANQSPQRGHDLLFRIRRHIDPINKHTRCDAQASGQPQKCGHTRNPVTPLHIGNECRTGLTELVGTPKGRKAGGCPSPCRPSVGLASRAAGRPRGPCSRAPSVRCQPVPSRWSHGGSLLTRCSPPGCHRARRSAGQPLLPRFRTTISQPSSRRSRSAWLTEDPKPPDSSLDR